MMPRRSASLSRWALAGLSLVLSQALVAEAHAGPTPVVAPAKSGAPQNAAPAGDGAAKVADPDPGSAAKVKGVEANVHKAIAKFAASAKATGRPTEHLVRRQKRLLKAVASVRAHFLKDTAVLIDAYWTADRDKDTAQKKQALRELVQLRGMYSRRLEGLVETMVKYAKVKPKGKAGAKP